MIFHRNNIIQDTGADQTLLEHIALLELDQRVDSANQIIEPCSSFFSTCAQQYSLKAVGKINHTDPQNPRQREIIFRESTNCDFNNDASTQQSFKEQFCNSDLEKIKLSGSDYGTALFATNQNDRAVCMYGLAIGAEDNGSEHGRTYFLRLTKLRNWLDKFLTEYFISI